MAELVREIMIDATPETIWPFLTDPERHVEWLGTVAEIDPRPGRCLSRARRRSAPVRGRVPRGGADGEGCRSPSDGNKRGTRSRRVRRPIEISLHPEGDKTLVRLVHRGLPDDAVSDHGHGWAHYLSRLAIAATGGNAGADIAPSGD